mgnify:CR=1 FL=1
MNQRVMPEIAESVISQDEEDQNDDDQFNLREISQKNITEQIP